MCPLCPGAIGHEVTLPLQGLPGVSRPSLSCGFHRRERSWLLACFCPNPWRLCSVLPVRMWEPLQIFTVKSQDGKTQLGPWLRSLPQRSEPGLHRAWRLRGAYQRTWAFRRRWEDGSGTELVLCSGSRGQLWLVLSDPPNLMCWVYAFVCRCLSHRQCVSGGGEGGNGEGSAQTCHSHSAFVFL